MAEIRATKTARRLRFLREKQQQQPDEDFLPLVDLEGIVEVDGSGGRLCRR